MFPDLELPPKPVITRWGTWIEAAIYYANNFEKVRTFLNELDPSEAKSIKKAQDAIKVPNLKTQLAFIKSNFSCIVSSITKLQKNGMQLEESLEIVEAVGEKLKQMRGRPEFFKKYEQVATKNKGLAKLRLISNILELGKSTNPDEYVDSLTPEEIDAFKYAPITSSDVERSFSKYKNVLSDNRRSFLFDNLAKHVIIYCNKLD